MPVLVFILGLACLGLIALLTLRLMDRRTDALVWADLLARQPSAPRWFDPAQVAGLPDPARRYFLFAITPGARLSTVAEIDMDGEFGLGTKEKPNHAPMRARQVLALPFGFVWCMRSGMISGSDGLSPAGSWTRFRILGLVPVARQGFTGDHRRSAFARAVAEALFWTPAALLPGPGIGWDQTGPNTARVTVRHVDLEQSVEITVAADGAPLSMVMPRWSDANPEKRWQLQPFGATFGKTAEFGGYRLPVEVEAGNFFGTPEYFAFFKASVKEIRFP